MLEKYGVTIGLDNYYSAYTGGTDEDNPKIIIDCGHSDTIGVNLNRCVDCHISDIEVKDSQGIGFRIYRCTDVAFTDCIAHDIGISSSESEIGGFVIKYSDADFYNCKAYNIATTSAGTGAIHADGFNIHYTGTTHFYNCSAYNCEDDGISHHDACRGYVEGGEYYNCGKAGVASPTHGATINVSGVYSHDNANGLYIITNGSTLLPGRDVICISNCVFKNNSSKDIITDDFYTIKIWNCIFDTIEAGENTTVISV